MPSFDTVSEINLQEVDNAVNQAFKEISQRFDFRGSEAKIEFQKTTNTIHIVCNNEGKIEDIINVLYTKAARRQIDLKAFKKGKVDHYMGKLHRCIIELVQGIEKEAAKDIVKFIKEMKIKVQAAIHDDKVRVTAKKIDDLQTVMAALRKENFGLPLQFNNFRD